MRRSLRICKHCEEEGRTVKDAHIPLGESRRRHLATVHAIDVSSQSWKENSVKLSHFRYTKSRAEVEEIGANEASLYQGVKSGFERLFKHKFDNCYLEITAEGKFSPSLKAKVPPNLDIVFSFLRRNYPDITGFIQTNLGTNEFITIEVKKDPLTLDDVIQGRAYADLFLARYGILISTDPLPEELKRLHKATNILNRQLPDKTNSPLFLAEWNRSKSSIIQDSWFPYPPFPDDSGIM